MSRNLNRLPRHKKTPVKLHRVVRSLDMGERLCHRSECAFGVLEWVIAGLLAAVLVLTPILLHNQIVLLMRDFS